MTEAVAFPFTKGYAHENFRSSVLCGAYNLIGSVHDKQTRVFIQWGPGDDNKFTALMHEDLWDGWDPDEYPCEQLEYMVESHLQGLLYSGAKPQMKAFLAWAKTECADGIPYRDYFDAVWAARYTIREGDALTRAENALRMKRLYASQSEELFTK